MNYNHCPRCNQDLPVEQFNIKNKKTGKLQPYCAECNKAASREYYARNKEHHKNVVMKRNNRVKKNLQQKVWEYLLSNPCVDCGEIDPVVLDFDHTDPTTKLASISDLVVVNRRKWEVVYAEILKCQVRCANCHRRKTAKQFNWYMGHKH